MGKGKQINIRIPDNEYNFVKQMDASFSQIWQVGFEKWSLEYPDFLQKKVQEYKFMYSKCIERMQDCNAVVYTKRKDLDELYKVYVENGRSIQNPSPHDKSWIRARITKIGNGLTMDKFFEYCLKRFEDEKQKRLEVLE